MVSDAYRQISDADRSVLFALAMGATPHNNGDLSLTRNEAKRLGVNSEAKLRAGLETLTRVGLIERTRVGGLANGTKQCNLYALSWRDIVPSEKFDFPFIRGRKASHDYAKWVAPPDWKAIAREIKNRARGRKTVSVSRRPS